MLAARNSSIVPAVSSSARPEEIAETVKLWQSRYQMSLDLPPAPPAPAAPAIETAPHLKEAAASWFAEARRQDEADDIEIRTRVSNVLGRGLLG